MIEKSLMGGDQRRLAKEISFVVSESKYKKIKTFTRWLWSATQCTPRVPRQGATFYIFIPPSTCVTTVTHEHYYSNSTTTNYHHRNMALLAVEHSTVQFKAQLRCFLHLDAGQDHLGHLGLKGRSTALHRSKTSLLSLKLCRIFYSNNTFYVLFSRMCNWHLESFS